MNEASKPAKPKREGYHYLADWDETTRNVFDKGHWKPLLCSVTTTSTLTTQRYICTNSHFRLFYPKKKHAKWTMWFEPQIRNARTPTRTTLPTILFSSHANSDIRGASRMWLVFMAMVMHVFKLLVSLCKQQASKTGRKVGSAVRHFTRQRGGVCAV